jgi:hypothetical protein
MKRISLISFCLILAAGFMPLAHSQKPTPQLSELQKLKVQNLELKFKDDTNAINALTSDQANIRAQYSDLLKKIEDEFPGFTVDVTGADPVLVPKPAPVKPAETPKK